MTAILKEFWEHRTCRLPTWPSAPGGITGVTSAGAPVDRGRFLCPNTSPFQSISFSVSLIPAPQVRDYVLDRQVCVSKGVSSKYQMRISLQLLNCTCASLPMGENVSPVFYLQMPPN